MLLSLILPFFLFILAQTQGNDPLISEIRVYEGSYILKTYPVELYNVDGQKDIVKKLSITGKLCFLKEFEQLKKTMDKYNDFYNKRWILQIGSKYVIRQTISYLNNLTSIESEPIMALIIDNSLKDELFILRDIPIFTIDPLNFNNLKGFNIDSEEGNIFINVFYDATFYSFPEQYLFYCTMSVAIVITLVTIIWHYLVYRLYHRHVIALQKIVSAFPYMDVVLSALIFYSVKEEIDNKKTPSQNSSIIYIDTIIITVSSIMKTILWFVIILVASGWQITHQILTRDEIRNFIKVYFFIYLTVCLDPIIDVVIHDVGVFQPSEIKNFIFYGMMSFFVLYKGRATRIVLKNKLLYAVTLAEQYIPALILKLKIINYHVGISLVYTMLYVLMVCLQKLVFLKYSSSLVTVVNNNLIDFIIIALYLLLYHPRKLPQYFTVDYGNGDIQELGDVYSITLPKYRDLKNRLLSDFPPALTHSQITLLKNEPNYPVVVLNPIVDDEPTGNNINSTESNSLPGSLRMSPETEENEIGNSNIPQESRAHASIESISIGYYRNI